MGTDDKRIEKQKKDPDTIIKDLGGCGRFQVRMTVIVHLMKTIFCFSTSNLLISTATPTWWCVNDDHASNESHYTNMENASVHYDNEMACTAKNGTKCTTVTYDSSLNSLVNEFDLICDKDFIPGTLSSLQLTGQLAGNIISGQLADLFGRKRPFFSSVMILLTFHVVGFFSVSWEMFAVSTFFVGISQGFFLTIQYNLLSEFTLAKWRVWIIGFPSWQLQSSLFALIAWLLHDWRYLQLMTAISALPCLLAWWFIPESFRWYYAHDKPKEAMNIIKTVAKFNRHDLVNIENSFQSLELVTTKSDKRYTFLHLFKSRALARITLLLMIDWFGLGLVGYGLYFGIQKLSGNIYLNAFLFTLCAIPSKSIALWLQNRIGRGNTTIICFVIIAVIGLTVGILQTLDVPHKDVVTNVLSFTANAGIGAAWSSVQTITVELYPTVVRNIGFGTVGVISGLASVLGPQLVYLESYFSGLLYYVCGAVAILCVLSTLALPETKDKNLNDKIAEMTKLDGISSIDIEVVNKAPENGNVEQNGHI
ncbi:organic cation/carnitine transporter 2-like [Mercenaria mercenaria]|uniref:organic cation/carnitine transporter 2-like n=1 Tax=Mercenaria mercenaria TaxID=6596 RepID=UPI00234F73A6|nr:organic cation/carnitine transporter 2-like [Mercenaria mercenaria]